MRKSLVEMRPEKVLCCTEWLDGLKDEKLELLEKLLLLLPKPRTITTISNLISSSEEWISTIYKLCQKKSRTLSPNTVKSMDDYVQEYFMSSLNNMKYYDGSIKLSAYLNKNMRLIPDSRLKDKSEDEINAEAKKYHTNVENIGIKKCVERAFSANAVCCDDEFFEFDPADSDSLYWKVSFDEEFVIQEEASERKLLFNQVLEMLSSKEMIIVQKKLNGDKLSGAERVFLHRLCKKVRTVQLQNRLDN